MRDPRLLGLFRKVANGPFYAERRVPVDLQNRLGSKLKQALRTKDFGVAEVLRDAQWRLWDEQFAAMRLAGTGPVATVEEATAAIESWRRARCAAAAGPVEEVRQLNWSNIKPSDVLAGINESYRGQPKKPVVLDVSNIAKSLPSPVLSGAFLDWVLLDSAKALFANSPHLSREVHTPTTTQSLLGHLQVAAREEGGWVKIIGFDDRLAVAVAEGGLASPLPANVVREIRQRFATAWLEVVQHEESARQRAAAVLAMDEALKTAPNQIRIQPAKNKYIAHEGDKTIGEVIKLYKSERSEKLGEVDTEKKFSHIFRAIEEVVGGDKPIRSITRDDAREVYRLLCQLPKNASKIYPGLPLKVAAEKGEEDERPLMAPNTVRSYMSNFHAICNFDIKEEWLEKNPVQIPKKIPSLKRRAFSAAELKKLFGSLIVERENDYHKFWVPAILVYTGARANENCQLSCDDVQEEGGISFFDLTLFDSTGRKRGDARLKTAASARRVPVHASLVDSGFLEFVKKRRASGGGRLFPQLSQADTGTYSHEFSKWFGRHCDAVGLSDPCLVLHSFRHGFRDAGRAAGLPDGAIDALGGWSAKGEGAQYGNRDLLAVNANHMDKIGFGEFDLVRLLKR